MKIHKAISTLSITFILNSLFAACAAEEPETTIDESWLCGKWEYIGIWNIDFEEFTPTNFGEYVIEFLEDGIVKGYYSGDVPYEILEDHVYVQDDSERTTVMYRYGKYLCADYSANYFIGLYGKLED